RPRTPGTELRRRERPLRCGRREEACEDSPPAKATRRRSRLSTPDDRARWGGAAHGRRAPHMCLHEDRNGRHCVGSAARPHRRGCKRARPRTGERPARGPRGTARELYTRRVPPRRRPMRKEFSVVTKIVNHWFGGKTAESASAPHGPVTNPATGEVTTKVAYASVEEVDAVV